MNDRSRANWSWAMVLPLLAACGSMQPVTQVRDDVYYSPSQEVLIAATVPSSSAPTSEATLDDYYDPDTAKSQSGARNYYDVTYNDPYYYNQARFGFGVGVGMAGPSGMASMGWQTGWGGGMDPYSSTSFGLGMGYGWGNPYMSMGMGYGWGYPYMGMGYGWGSPWCGAGYNPWMYDPWGMGWGAGPYWGPWGSCWNCYAPIMVGGTAGAVYGPRPSVGTPGVGVPVTGGGQPRALVRNPISLDPFHRQAVDQANRSTGRSITDPDNSTNRSRYEYKPVPNGALSGWSRPNDGRERNVVRRPSRQMGDGGLNLDPGRSTREGGLNRSGSFDRSNGGGFSPGGGGSRTPGTGRPR